MSNIVNMIVVAHPDDEILGFGATGAKLVKRDEIVQPVILCGNADARTHRPNADALMEDMINANNHVGFQQPALGDFPNIKMNNVDHIEVVQFIESKIEEFQPHRIFTHHPADLNVDHSHISKACMVASRYFQRRDNIRPLKSLHLMEILSSTEWSFPTVGDSFSPNTFEEVEDFIEVKINALACYREVMRPHPHPRSEEVMRGLAAYRGSQCGCRYAEVFQTVFQVGLI
ncbi:MAG: PIG-L deacetylase family protein [Thermoleophilia bacterium]